MKICDILTKDLIIPDLREQDKEKVLAELVNHLAVNVEGINPDELLGVLLEREKLGSTGIGDGVAIPHGKLKGIQKIIALFGKSSHGVEFDSMDGKPVYLFFLLIAPENSAGVHLKALARLSRLLKNTGFRQHLMDSSDAKSIYSIIAQEDAQYVV
ncbi:MAG: PTS sugar transporter subunit IIA [Proteobacteria bacterium]|nr:PTS sugar transporter subunit IIA [Pseudomonadota bacterium]